MPLAWSSLYVACRGEDQGVMTLVLPPDRGFGDEEWTMVKVDLRDSLGFLSMLRACAAISALTPGACLAMVCNDADLLPDLRRVHPECRFLPLAAPVGRPGDYAFGVEKTN